MTIKHMMAKFNRFSWINCGTLLGWWRQCSLIPNDPDIDMVHWNSLDLYPQIIKEIMDHPEIYQFIKATIDYGPLPEILGKQEGFYVKTVIKKGKSVDLYFNYKHKVYDTRHHAGRLEKFDFTDNVCSADLHGYLVYVPCTDAKIRELNLMWYGQNYMSPK